MTGNQKLFILIIIILILAYIIYNGNKTSVKSNLEEVKKTELYNKLLQLYNKILQLYNIKEIDVSTTSRVFDNVEPVPILVSQNKLYYLFANKHGLYKISLRYDKNKLEYKTEQLRFYDSTKFVLSQSGEFIAYKDDKEMWSSKPYTGFTLLNMSDDGKLIFTMQILSGTGEHLKQIVKKDELYLYQIILDAQEKHYMIYDDEFDNKIKKLMK